MKRRDRTNAAIHLTGTPGTPSARARLSGHLVLQRLAMLEAWPAANFAGATVEFAPGLTVYALDVCKLYRLTPASSWEEYGGGVATPELEPPRAPRANPRAPRAPRRPAPRARGPEVGEALRLLREVIR